MSMCDEGMEVLEDLFHSGKQSCGSMEVGKLKAAENVTDADVEGTSSSVRSERADEISNPKSSAQKSASIDKDLDVFLLGDLDDSDDDGPDDGNDDSDDDGFEKL
ncbi:hypothetical protein SASPL_151530 [Salvia splendens]|uniref:Uncharacterized protein n=1 Tax=Salvia splendens TaxID=180675 RepID=A0A8X8W842_SALSN|nr:hypothetical protein SASPL_151530 [Salvia splendens]